MNFTDPKMMALLSAGGSLLQSSGASPRPINLGEAMGNAVPAAMQGAHSAYAFQQQEEQRKKIANEALQRIQAQEFLQKHQQSGSDPRAIAQSALMSGNPILMGIAGDITKSMPKVKSTIKGYDESGNPVFHNVMDTGEVSATNIRPAEKMSFQNTGQETLGIDPFTGERRLSLQNSMAPGEQARLAQSAQQFGASHSLAQANHGLAQQNAAFARQQAVKPQFKDGYWITPPNANNPQGSMLPTDLATAPKGSQAEKTRMSTRIKDTLGEDTENLIKQATGSTFGSIRDSGAAMFGVTTDPAKANATLKLRAATLAGNMPRFEGPQSDADRAYYLEMAGDLANPSKTTEEKLMALKELKRLHNLDGQSKSQTSSDGWGDLR